MVKCSHLHIPFNFALLDEVSQVLISSWHGLCTFWNGPLGCPLFWSTLCGRRAWWAIDCRLGSGMLGWSSSQARGKWVTKTTRLHIWRWRGLQGRSAIKAFFDRGCRTSLPGHSPSFTSTFYLGQLSSQWHGWEARSGGDSPCGAFAGSCLHSQ